MEGGAPAELVAPLLVLLAWSALFFVIGQYRLGKRFA
jgi:hypothetical protein